MLKHPFGGKVSRDSTKSIWESSLFVFMNISEKNINWALIIYPVQTKLEWTTKGEEREL